MKTHANYQPNFDDKLLFLLMAAVLASFSIRSGKAAQVNPWLTIRRGQDNYTIEAQTTSPWKGVYHSVHDMNRAWIRKNGVLITAKSDIHEIFSIAISGINFKRYDAWVGGEIETSLVQCRSGEIV